MAQFTTKTIPQSKLQRYYELKLAVEELESLKKEILEMAVKEKMIAQPGPFSFVVNPTKGQCRPAWKDIAIELAVKSGEDAAKFEEEVKAKTPIGAGGYSLEVINRNAPVKE